MTIRSSIIMGGMAAAIALTAAGGAGATPTPLYGGGSTLVEKVYRDLFNTYGSTASGDLCAGITIDPCPTTAYNANAELLMSVSARAMASARSIPTPRRTMSRATKRRIIPRLRRAATSATSMGPARA